MVGLYVAYVTHHIQVIQNLQAFWHIFKVESSFEHCFTQILVDPRSLVEDKHKI